MNGGDHRQARGAPQQGTDHIGPAAVAVDQLIAALLDVCRQFPPQVGNVVAAADHGGDAHGPGLLGKGAVPEADQLGGDGFVQVLQQAQHVGLGPAGIAAADEVDDLHKSASKKILVK